MAVVEYGIDPILFWNYTPKDIDLISERQLKLWREKYEFESWKISWLLAPHVSKSVKPSDIFDYEKIQSGIEITPEEEFENFDKMFMDNEKKKQKDREKIVSELKRINAKAEEEKRNGISN